MLSLSIGIRVSAQALLVSLTQAPGLVKQLLPLASTASQVQEIGDLNALSGEDSSGLSTSYNNLLKTLMTDVPSFIAFASTGKWSGGITADDYQSFTGFDLMLKTYITSVALKQNNYYAIVKSANYHMGDWFKDSNPRGPSYYSEATARVYTLFYDMHDVSGAPKNGYDTSTLMKTILDQGWSGCMRIEEIEGLMYFW